MQLAANALNAALIRHSQGYVATSTTAEYMLFLAARPRLAWVVLGLLSRVGGGRQQLLEHVHVERHLRAHDAVLDALHDGPHSALCGAEWLLPRRHSGVPHAAVQRASQLRWRALLLDRWLAIHYRRLAHPAAPDDAALVAQRARCGWYRRISDTYMPADLHVDGQLVLLGRRRQNGGNSVGSILLFPAYT